MLFFDIDNPSPDEIKVWMKKNDFTIDSGSFALGISKRQFARFLSGETSATVSYTHLTLPTIYSV